MTELAHRRNHHFDVALYWDTHRDELFVVVEDIGAGDRFSIAALRQAAQRGRLEAFQGSDGVWRSTRSAVDEYARKKGQRRPRGSS